MPVPARRHDRSDRQTALITGSARGLGKAIALRYATRGANIVVNYAANREAADTTAAEIERLGVKAFSPQGDMSKVADIEQLFTPALDQFGQIDIAVANAGIELISVPFVEITEDQFDRQLAINTKGTSFTLQAAARHVVDNGLIIYISSSTAALPFAGEVLCGACRRRAGLSPRQRPKSR
ncbi:MULTISPECIES: SDR family NAD(P)-dependent oxidoreductase [unclassified Streptomyces]|jgi:Dehydrogenases with different specificities (related to short-chain alcohol dehydrogenases)|uniref:SDR family NAD(P)-dependent oxidoreductase n=1 Tax=unclassified Streptomyces TaxID=2593676 RepID=UPI002E254BD3